MAVPGKIQHRITLDPTIPLLGMIPKRIGSRGLQYLYIHVLWHITHNTHNVEKRLKCRMMMTEETKCGTYVHNGILSGLKKEGDSGTCYFMEP